MTRGDVHLVRLDPTLGSEIQKTRPCVMVFPDELNAHLRTVIVAPMTTAGRAYPGGFGRHSSDDPDTSYSISCAQVDRERLVKRLGAFR